MSIADRVAALYLNKKAGYGKPESISEQDLKEPLTQDALVVIEIDGDPVSLTLRKGDKPLPAIEKMVQRATRDDKTTLKPARASRATEVAYTTQDDVPVVVELRKKR